MTDVSRPKHFTSYNSAVRDVVRFGQKCQDTLALYDAAVSHDIHRDDSGYFVTLPENRLGSKISLPYFEAELLWYMCGSLRAKEIAPIAKIWYDMADHNGRVNSNYGVQLFRNYGTPNARRLESPKRSDVIESLSLSRAYDAGARYFHILNRENQLSKTDLPCNDAVRFDPRGGGRLDMHVYARSIDVVFGLPYDSAFFQTVLIATSLVSRRIPGSVTFHIANLHAYESSLSKLDEGLNVDAMLTSLAPHLASQRDVHVPFNALASRLSYDLSDGVNTDDIGDVITSAYADAKKNRPVAHEVSEVVRSAEERDIEPAHDFSRHAFSRYKDAVEFFEKSVTRIDGHVSDTSREAIDKLASMAPDGENDHDRKRAVVVERSESNSRHAILFRDDNAESWRLLMTR